MIIPSRGGHNMTESYDLAFYAAARHTRLECFDKNGEKGFFFLIGDEYPTDEYLSPSTYSIAPQKVADVFGDSIQAPVSMLDIVKEVHAKYHVFVIRPGDTAAGGRKDISTAWADLLGEAGGNPQHVLEVPTMKDIIPAILLSVARIFGSETEIINVLTTRGDDVAGAIAATAGVKVENAVAIVSTEVRLPTTEPDGSIPDAPERR